MLEKTRSVAKAEQHSDNTSSLSDNLLNKESLYLAGAGVATGMLYSRARLARAAENCLPKISAAVDDIAKTASSSGVTSSKVVHEMQTYVLRNGFDNPAEIASVKVVQESFKPGMSKFRVVDHNLIARGSEDNYVAFARWGKNVQNLDIRLTPTGNFRNTSDSWQIWRASEELKFGRGKNSVYLQPTEFYSRSVESVREALRNVVYRPLNSYDI